MKDARDHRIQTFNLFGESGDLPDVVHCETIEARSRLHNWELAIHRHARLHQILFLDSGRGRAEIEGERLDLPPGTLCNVPIGCVHGFSFEPGTSGHVVTLAAETLDAVLNPNEGLRPVLARARVLPARPEVTRTIRHLAQTFGSRAFGRAQILRSLAGLLLGQIARELASGHNAAEMPAAPPLLARFEALLDAHFTDHWPVAEYAKALAVSSTHLSRVTRQATGQPATRLIEERIVREARRNLVYTNLPVSTIAYALGYSDPAYFSRVFSRATGLSPRVFRTEAAVRGLR